MKRVIDMVAAAIGLALLAPLFSVIALMIKLDSPGPVFFLQRRMGRNFRPFLIYKFRTMSEDAETSMPLTVGADPRITRVGHFLRRSKLDEMPQLLNVLKGDMTLVGPRPEVPRYVELFRRDYEEILRVRPGITDLASLKYHDEASLLASAERPEEKYVRDILPDKIRLAKAYSQQASLRSDLALVVQTLRRLMVHEVRE